MQQELKKTVFHDHHVDSGAQMVDFGGWDMPIQYPLGILQEHLITRKQAGLFDVSHMGRFVISGKNALPYLQHVLTNNAAALELEESQYTLIPNEQGGAVDDAYLYRFLEDEYLLVVNAANRKKDWNHLSSFIDQFGQVTLEDRSHEMAMLSLQGPASKAILSELIESGRLPEPMRNQLGQVQINGTRVFLARTGYTGEPICFELFIQREKAPAIWDSLIGNGVQPVGLGARDTLRLEAGLPLYGHELGEDPEGNEIPIFASSLSRFAVSFSPLKGDFVGHQALHRQFETLKRIADGDHTDTKSLPRLVMPVAVTGKGIARQGFPVFLQEQQIGHITSGTMVPYWKSRGEGIASELTDEKGSRAVALALLDSTLVPGDCLDIQIRNKRVEGVVVPYHLRSEAPPFARAIPHDQIQGKDIRPQARAEALSSAKKLLTQAIANTRWRQQLCINLIPSEQSPSTGAKLLSIMDPVGRYAEHKQVKAFSESEVFYYQGTEFIAEVENLLMAEFQRYLGCAEVETRLISGQMANTCVFSALVDYLNRMDRKREPRRIQKVLNHHIIKGGHLSAQPMGALRDFIAREPQTERPAVVHFPVLEENPYQVDVAACREIIAQQRPELVIFGRSMTLHTEPVAEIRALVDENELDCTLMYDMSHVLGLAGPYFQEPFKEGVDLVTGSTHKTYFGTQRGIVASAYKQDDAKFDLWKAVQRRAFPGSVSNHHMGTLVGLLLAAYEMSAFKETYQQKVLANAKAFARALHDCGLEVGGDPSIDFTQTHQVIIHVGYAKGPEIAQRLEENNIIVNYQATAEEEGFTASRALRMGVQEMTRFGMEAADFQALAQLMVDVIDHNKPVREEIVSLRKRFLDMQFCFQDSEIDELLQAMTKWV